MPAVEYMLTSWLCMDLWMGASRACIYVSALRLTPSSWPLGQWLRLNEHQCGLLDRRFAPLHHDEPSHKNKHRLLRVCFSFSLCFCFFFLSTSSPTLSGSPPFLFIFLFFHERRWKVGASSRGLFKERVGSLREFSGQSKYDWWDYKRGLSVHLQSLK